MGSRRTGPLSDWDGLPDHLCPVARMCVYRACQLSVGGAVEDLAFSDCSAEDNCAVLGAVVQARYITLEDYAPGRRRWRGVERQ